MLKTCLQKQFNRGGVHSTASNKKRYKSWWQEGHNEPVASIETKLGSKGQTGSNFTLSSLKGWTSFRSFDLSKPAVISNYCMKYYDFIVCGELKSKEEWRNELPEWKKYMQPMIVTLFNFKVESVETKVAEISGRILRNWKEISV